jgi:hypothetical protein
MRDHYDFTGGVRGKYAARYAASRIVIVVDGDVPRDLDGNPISKPKAGKQPKTTRKSPARKAARRKG